jgi:elongation factor P
MTDFDQFTLNADILGNATNYLLEGAEVTLLAWENKPIAIELPVKVTLTVTDAPPGIKGDTASGGDKVVTLETGIPLTTPLFIKTGDKVIVNTEKGTYVSRA